MTNTTNTTPTSGDGENKITKKINPEQFILPDPEIIAFLAETRGVTEEEVLKALKPSPYLADLDAINACINEAFDITYSVPPTFLKHIERLLRNHDSKNIRSSMKLYFSDKDEFRDALGHGTLDKRKIIEMGNTIPDQFEKLFMLLIERIPLREDI